MTKFLKYFSIFILLTVLQYLFIEFFDIRGIHPDLFFILLIYIAFRLPPVHAVWAGFSVGVVQDILFNLVLIGLAPFIKTFFAYILGRIAARQRMINPILLITGMIVMILFNHQLFNWFYYVQVPGTDYSVFLGKTLPETAYTTVIFLMFNYFFPLLDSER